MRVSIPFILVVYVLSFTSCTEEMARSFKALPNAFGEINQIVVIAEEDVWAGPVGDTLRYYFAAAYPILPQPEPIYDLVHFTPTDLIAEPSRKEF